MAVCKAGNVNKVTQVTNQIFIITKEKVTMCVAHKDNIVVVFDAYQDMEDGLPFVALVHTYDRPGAAYDKCMFLIGKMCKKDYNSKYFRSHHYDEHLKNGNFDKASTEEIVNAIKETKEIVDDFIIKLVE